jgi:spermidine synthase
MPRGFVAVAVCFVLSGAASLVLQVVWTRLLRLTFGSTTLAVSTVLVAYMLGLGLGGLLGARLATRLRDGVRVYGWMEIAIGLYALAVPLLLGVLPEVNFAITGALPFWQAAFFRFILALGVMLVPTILMGATLPVLVEAMVRQQGAIALRVGLLYGLNTLGAVAGVLGATFVLFPLLGVRATNFAAAVVDIAVGVVAFAVLAPRFAPDRRGRSALAAGGEERTAPPPLPRLWSPALVAYGLVGFTSLTYEVSWTRALSMILGSSIYAFATMLAAFLVGIALGSLVARRWFDDLRRPLVAYAFGIGLLGLLALATIVVFRALPSVFVDVITRIGTSPAGVSATGIGVSILAMLGPTLVLGALFPLLIRVLAERPEQAPGAVGAAYFTNTLGSAAGAFAAGFVLIPLLGLQRTMGIAVGLNFLVAGLLLLAQRQWRGRATTATAVAAMIAAAIVIVNPPRWSAEELTRGVFRSPEFEIDVGLEFESLIGVPPSGLLYYREGVNTTVSVHRDLAVISLRVNGKADASSGDDMPTQVLSGAIPMLFGGDPGRILVIGLASGVTVGSVVLHDPDLVEVVELEPAMVEASHYFDDVNNRPLERDGVRLLVDDGRNVLAYSREPYDLIISEPSNPWITGASNLFTREFFAAARRSLRPGGQLLQWFQLYAMPGEGLRAILASLQAEFPYVYGFTRRSLSTDLLLLARDTPLTAEDLPRWEDLAPAVREDLVRVGILSTEDLWTLLLLPPGGVREIAAQASRQNTDDNMFVEILSPWALYQKDTRETYDVLASVDLGVLPVLEEIGVELTPERLGALAYAYIETHNDRALGEAILAGPGGSSAEGMAARAVLRAQLGEEEEARALLDEAVQLDMYAMIPRLERGRLRYDEGDFEGAVDDARFAVAAGPNDPRARFLHAQALVEQDRPEEALPELDELAGSAFAILEPDVFLALAQARAAQGDMEGAIDGVRKYNAAYPGDPSGWYLLGAYYEMMGRAEEAREAQENQRRATQNSAIGRHTEALRMERSGHIPGAISMLESITAEVPDYGPAAADLERLRGR